jgi:hypothetical protein
VPVLFEDFKRQKWEFAEVIQVIFPMSGGFKPHPAHFRVFHVIET